MGISIYKTLLYKILKTLNFELFDEYLHPKVSACRFWVGVISDVKYQCHFHLGRKMRKYGQSLWNFLDRQETS